MKINLELTRSQHMALTSLVTEHLRCPGASEVYIDCSTKPPTETKVEDLLALFTLTPSNAPEVQEEQKLPEPEEERSEDR